MMMGMWDDGRRRKELINNAEVEMLDSNEKLR